MSQNARQRGVTASTTSDLNKLYSYTRYDTLGRITEVGQIKNNNAAFMTDGISRSQGTLNSWFSARSNLRGQITNTVYDIGNSLLNSQLTAANLRNRVAYTQYTDTATNSGYNQATLYSYDIHGNVDTLLQDYGNSSIVALQNVMNKGNSAANNRWKKIVYGYDLISGKVNWVAYNPKRVDEFFHRYFYDAENRLTTVETSTDSLVWERDARYEYYRHGPLARTVIGQQLVQGMDYAYTLQGWLKGVNSAGGSPLGGGGDMGEDGKSNGQNKYIARDAVGYHLNYFDGDYTGINNIYNPFPSHYSNMPVGEARNLYNGNINSMMVNIGKLNEPLLYNYRYDQLNRLTGMDAYTGFRFQNNDWGISGTTLAVLRKDANGPDGAYKERIAYDANGNITRYLRKGRWGDTHMDSLTYNYSYSAQGQLQNNKLNFIRDRVNNNGTSYSGVFNDDLEDQAAGNYGYDEIGNLIKDTKENITSIKWNVYGKIQEINRTADANNNVSKINYLYDAAGNRISKRVQRSTNQTQYTWFVRDMQGNILSTYSVDSSSATVIPSTNLIQYDVHLYGSSRLGTLYRQQAVQGASATYTPPENLFFERGKKQYEFSSYNSNVYATFSDKKLGFDTTGDGQVDYFLADIRQVNDYHPFGFSMSNRTVTYNFLGYRFAYGSKEFDKEINYYDFGERLYDPRAVRTLSLDPLYAEFPFQSPYSFLNNSPLQFVDVDGMAAESANQQGGGRRRRSGRGRQAELEEFREEVRRNEENSYQQKLRQHEAKLRFEEEFIRGSNGQYRPRSPREREELNTERAGKVRAYLNSVLETGQSVFNPNNALFSQPQTGIFINKEKGALWENEVQSAMLKSGNYQGVVSQVTLKVVGVNQKGNAVEFRIRIDKVGLRLDKKIDLAEAKFSVEQITANNVTRTLQLNQKDFFNLLSSGSNVSIFFHGGKAKQAQMGMLSGTNITGDIKDIKIIVNNAGTQNNSSSTIKNDKPN